MILLVDAQAFYFHSSSIIVHCSGSAKIAWFKTFSRNSFRLFSSYWTCWKKYWTTDENIHREWVSIRATTSLKIGGSFHNFMCVHLIRRIQTRSTSWFFYMYDNHHLSRVHLLLALIKYSLLKQHPFKMRSFSLERAVFFTAFRHQFFEQTLANSSINKIWHICWGKL